MPYAPQVTPQPIRADMGGWGAALMQMLNQRDQNKQLEAQKAERAAEQAKKEAGEFKTYVAMGKQIGLNPDELTTQDLPTVKGMVEGAITKTKLEEAVANFQKTKSANASSDALTRAVEAAGQKRTEMPAFQIPGQAPGVMMPAMTATSSQPLTSQALLNAVARNPQAANDPQTINLVQALQQAEDPTRAMFAEANRLNAQVNMMDAQRRNAPPAANPPIPDAPDLEPPEGFVWNFDGKNWRQSQQRVGAAAKAGQSAAATPAKPGKITEVTRVTKDGRRVVFNAETKEFLRYAD